MSRTTFSETNWTRFIAMKRFINHRDSSSILRVPSERYPCHSFAVVSPKEMHRKAHGTFVSRCKDYPGSSKDIEGVTTYFVSPQFLHRPGEQKRTSLSSSKKDGKCTSSMQPLSNENPVFCQNGWTVSRDVPPNTAEGHAHRLSWRPRSRNA